MLLNAFQDVKRPLKGSFLCRTELYKRVIRICINEQDTIFIITFTILLSGSCTVTVNAGEFNCNCVILTQDLIYNLKIPKVRFQETLQSYDPIGTHNSL